MADTLRVLYVDDEPGLLEIGKEFLEQSGDFAITTALGAPEAIRLLEHERFDAIISDYQMPGMDGIQFLIEVRKKHGPVPFILFTGKGREEVVIQAINSGADFYLQKGGDPGAQFAELTHKIKSAASRKRVEMALRESEEKFHSLYMHMVEGAALHELTYDDQGNPKDYVIIEANPAFETQLGISRDTVIGKTSREVYGVTEPPYLEIYTRVALTGEEEVFETYYPPLAKHFSISVYCPYKGSFATIFEDITKRKRTEEAQHKNTEELHAAYEELTASQEELRANLIQLTKQDLALRESEEKFRGLFSGNRDGVVIVDTGGHFVEANPVYCAMLGYRIEELQHITFPDITPKKWQAWEKDEIWNRRLMKEGYSGIYEKEYIRKDGTVFPVELQAFSVFDHDSTIRYVWGIARDITGRKLEKEAFRESEARYRTLVEHIPQKIFMKDLNSRYVSINENFARDLGILPDEIIGKSDADLFPAHLAAKYLADDIRVMETGQTEEFEERYLNEGIETWVHTIKTVVRDKNGNVSGVCGVFWDITGSKRAKEDLLLKSEELAAAGEELKSQFDALAEKERSLHDSEAQKTAILNGITTNIAFVDKNLRILWANKVAAESVKKSPAEMIGHTCHAFWADPARPCENCPTLRAFETKQSEHTIMHTPDGRVWDERGEPVFDENGNLIGVVEIAGDITRQKQAEEALAESEEVFREVFNNAIDAIFLHEILPDGLPGKYFRVNDIACTRLGYTREELYRMSPLDIVSPRHRLNIPDISVTIKSRGYATFESIYQRKDGSSFPVEINTHLFTLQGRQVALSIARDITGRQLADEKLQRLTEFQESIITNARVWLSVLDPRGTILMWNTAAEEISGYRSDEVIGEKEIWKRIYPDKEYRKQVTNTINRIIHDKNYLENFETTIVSKQGTKKVISWNTRGIPDATGNASDYIAVGVDVTARKQADEALRQANRKLNLLSSITRHDINNQLMALNGFLVLLRKKAQGPDLEDYFNRITRASSRVSAMIQFTKEYEQVGVNAPVWQDARTLVERAAKEAPLGKIIVQNDLPGGTEVFADPLVFRVFYNMMDNAARYGGKISTIRFSALDSGNEKTIVCEDDGEGIPAEEKEKIFERGFGKNTGLGLFLSREILDITGITITETGGLGKGARFEITVPMGAWRSGGKVT